jgi:hypothetical protein
MREVIKGKSIDKPYEREGKPGHFKWKPKNENEIQVGRDKPVQRRDLVQYVHLDKDKEYKPDDIFY